MPVAPDPLKDRTPSDTAPGDDGFAITPSDTAGEELPAVARALYVGASGHLKVKTERGTELLFKSVPVGWFVGVRVRQVLATGTTATDIVGVP
jgi:hypothetical protein